MKHDFTGKSIKCETWEQMLHLAKLAEVQGYREIGLNKCDFNDGAIYFYVVQGVYLNNHSKKAQNVVTYSYFINQPLPTEVVEVTDCDDCVMYKGDSEGFFTCRHPNQDNSGLCQFDTCPLKKSSITIKLKQNEPTGN